MTETVSHQNEAKLHRCVEASCQVRLHSTIQRTFRHVVQPAAHVPDDLGLSTGSSRQTRSVSTVFTVLKNGC